MFEQMFRTNSGSDVGVWPWLAGSDLKLGTGFDTLRYEPCGTAVEEKADSVTDPEKGQKTLYKLLIIEDERHFRETLSISASASFKGITGNASARMSLFRSVKIDTYSLYVLASVSVLNSTVGLQRPGLIETAREEWTRTRPRSQRNLFVTIFGDVFVTSITSGGELFALFELSCSSFEEKQSLAIQVSGSMGAWGGSADYQRSVEEFRKHKSLSLHIARDGGTGELPKPDLDSLLQAAQSFPNEVLEHPVPIFFQTQRYARVPDLGTDIDVEARHARYKIEDLARANDDFSARAASWKYALKNPRLFKQVDEQTSRQTLVQIEETSIKLMRMAEDVVENRFNDLTKYEVPSLDHIARPPSIATGTKLPLQLTALWLQGNGRTSNETEDGWLEGQELFSFGVKTEALPEGTMIKYMYHRGGSGDTGSVSAPEMTPEGRHEFVRIWLEGPQAKEFVIAYRVRRAGTSATYVGENGGRAGEPGQYMRISGIKVDLYKS
jgi:hypothetical protein